uniref:legumain n=1 Tax=Globodera rostochiensis TaxID=31243 RepID=A0A914HM55_GLORO
MQFLSSFFILFAFFVPLTLSRYSEEQLNEISSGLSSEEDGQRISITYEQEGDSNDQNIWAVLVAGSSGWFNYRHQADICHAYHTLINHGMAKERIITMMFDDIANNKHNPYKGKIFNEPGGKDVYKGVKIDYRGSEVNPQNFEAVLLGDKLRSGGKPVLKSTKNDKVFVYFADHGAVGLIGFPQADLTVKDLTQTLTAMHAKKMYGELTFYLEACESGSMFDHTLAKSLKIYAVTAANAEESSWGCFCETDFLPGNCLGDLFSVNWIQDSDQENLSTETLRTQFGIVRQKTNTSHVMHYGDLLIEDEHVAEFMGNKHAPKRIGRTESPHNYPMFPSRDIPLMMMARRQNESHEIGHNLHVAWKKRSFLEEQIKQIVHKLVHDANNRRHVLTIYPQKIRDLDCHHEVVHTFSNFCFKFSENPYALKYAYVFVNLCERPELDAERIKMALVEQCADVELSGVI